jgi:archaellum component FlaF (FlaF/FlaG flagellin family)
MSITAYEDIKNACAEAIRSIQARNNVEVNKTYTTDSSKSTADVVTKDQKKEKFEKEVESA